VTLTAPQTELDEQQPSWWSARSGSRFQRAIGYVVARSAVFGPIFAPFILAVVFGTLDPRFLSPANLQNISEGAAILLVLTIGITYLILMGAIDLSVGALFSLGGVTFATLLPWLSNWAFAIVIAGGAIAGLLNGLVHVRLRIPSFIATFGMGGIWATVALGVSHGTEVNIPQAYWPDLAWASSTYFGIPATVFVAAGAVMLALILERRTRFGRYAFAIGAGEEAARVSGIPVDRYKALAFGLSGAVSAGAGALGAARLLAGSPVAGLPYLLLAIAVVVVGGTALTGGSGGILRSVPGALIMTIVVNGMTILGVSPFSQQMLTGAIVIGAVIVTTDRRSLLVTK
jgi:ribose transport system permease protein